MYEIGLPWGERGRHFYIMWTVKSRTSLVKLAKLFVLVWDGHALEVLMVPDGLEVATYQ